MKKFFLILIPSLVFTFLFIFGYQSLLKYQAQKGALQVTSAPESKVYLDNKYIGQTPLCKCEANAMLQSGNYTIRLVPTDTSLPEFQEKVTITSGVLTVVDRKFAKDALSEGSIISLSPLTDKQKSSLLVVALPEGATVVLDNNEVGTAPLILKDPTESDHILKVRKNGYKEKTIRIRTPLGYKLTVAVYLSTIDDLSSDTSTSPSPQSPDASPTPPADATVTILDTPTGFLRVRDSIDGAETGKVTPGDTYALVNEESGWYEIRLKDGTNGWISSAYAQKN